MIFQDCIFPEQAAITLSHFLLPFLFSYSSHLVYPLSSIPTIHNFITSINIHCLLIHCPSNFISLYWLLLIFISHHQLFLIPLHSSLCPSIFVLSILHIHIPKASSLLSYSFLSVHVSAACSTVSANLNKVWVWWLVL